MTVTTSDSPVKTAYALIEQGRAAEAVALTEPLAAQPAPGHPLLAARAAALKALDRYEDALAVQQRAASAFPNSAVAWHNLAATLGDLARGEESVDTVRRAMALGLDGAETWIVLARALQMSGDLEGAERAYETTLQRQPGFTEAAHELAQLRWLRTMDPNLSTNHFGRAAASGAAETKLLLTKAKMLETAGRRDELRMLMDGAVQRRPNNVPFLRFAGHARMEDGDLDRAAYLVEQAERLAPDDVDTLLELAIVYLAQGRGEDALQKARRAVQIQPTNQAAWGWVATGARAIGDPLFRQLYDYERFVRPYDLATPDGWPTLEAYLDELAGDLRKLHRHEAHPFDQTLRGGSQTFDRLEKRREGSILAFFRLIEGPIREYMARVGRGDGPLPSRNTGEYRIAGAWSVLLRPSGFHLDHFHPQGWISSAFYVETPETALGRDSREGWIRFGQPPFATVPTMPAEHYVRPQPGRLVLFPSYMWHGTVPFTTDEQRMTVAFDAVPA